MPILDLGDLVPEHVPVRLNRIVGERSGVDGVQEYTTQAVTLQAYLYGPRCPVTVKASLRQISQRLQEATKEGWTDEKFQEYARDSFLQLIPGISFEEADLLASDDETKEGKCIKTLRYLQYWFGDVGEVVAETEETQTTPKSSPISA